MTCDDVIFGAVREELREVLTNDPDSPGSSDPTILVGSNLSAWAEIGVLSARMLLLLAVLILGLLLLRCSSQPGLDLAE